MNQAAVTVADILRQAERIGWTVSDTRAAEIAAVAAPAYAALERSSAELDFDVDTLSLFAALQENRAPPPSDAPAAGPMARIASAVHPRKLVRFIKSSTDRPEEKRARRPVGRTWFGPPT